MKSSGFTACASPINASSCREASSRLVTGGASSNRWSFVGRSSKASSGYFFSLGFMGLLFLPKLTGKLVIRMIRLRLLLAVRRRRLDDKVTGSLTRQQANKRDQRVWRRTLAAFNRYRIALTHVGPHVVGPRKDFEMAKSFSVLP